eukprot:jgi/Chrpa1/9043/Chrysochromulina_OHIO_Genome00017472-RA
MMIDFSELGLPEDHLHFATDAHSADVCTFELPDGSKLQAKQELRTGAGLGTGAVQWQSGTALAQALLDSSDLERLVASKRVLELGCGCAALPATISAIKGAASVVATDVAKLIPLVLANLREYGQTPGLSDANKHALASTLEARPLDWTSEEEVRSLAADARGFDLVLCADCVDESEALLRALADVISASLAPSGVALVASGARSQRLMALFLTALRRVGLDTTELAPSLRPLPAAEAAERARHNDATRFFAVTWPDADGARAARAARAVGEIGSPRAVGEIGSPRAVGEIGSPRA